MICTGPRRVLIPILTIECRVEDCQWFCLGYSWCVIRSDRGVDYLQRGVLSSLALTLGGPLQQSELH